MPAIKVSEVIARARTVLQDPSATRWPDAELVDWFNDAQLAICSRRPDTSVNNVPFSCAAGTKQTLPSDALRLIKLTRNLTTGKAVRSISGGILDDQVPDWHSQAETNQVTHYVFDPKDPKNFYVYPPASVNTSLEMVYTIAPSIVQVADIGSTSIFNDTYVNAITDFILFRAYSKDADYAANGARAQAHFAAFEAAMGNKIEPDSAMNPAPRPTGNMTNG